MTRSNKVFRKYLKRFFFSGLIIIFVFCVGATLFIQFYPFGKSPLLSKMNYPLKTTIKSGKPGDPINVLILGSKQTITRYFKEAGWEIPDPITDRTSVKIALDSLGNLPYPKAPVSNLYLYHRKQDLAFEKPTNSVRNRGHIRLWKTHTTINDEEVWLGSATYDHGIELSKRSHLPTHHILPSVDDEREKVVRDLKPFMKSALVVSFDQPNLFGFNGGGDWYYTDGNIAVLSVSPLNKDNISNHSMSLTLKQKVIQFLFPILNAL
ncbi:LssY C-terminal domain-containing protein [Heyndrickxia acidicola]|uniref:LssY C-terminal domain-containing protein n=1 Tax=Heyndrickxia acidicola TaxID=209389 RepID=A0ABU6MFL8_9BACI|nr:LssY C-terminal domain-containing protein [Heyndrickxia acidicola]MED1203479.1 LssY C-terminal domain-containing protein [Heyndrickxia acidicola]